MGKVLLGLVLGLLLGGAGGALVLGPALVGVGAGTGIAMGMKTAACIMQEARDEGIVTAEQLGEIVALTSDAFGADLPGGEEMTGPEDCDAFMAELREASAAE